MRNHFDYPVGKIPELTVEQMIEVDRAMIADYGIELIQMMENAGRSLAQLARQRFLAGNPQGKRVVVLAGNGGNGGGAMVCARRLSNWGASVELYLTEEPGDFKGVQAHQLEILGRLQLGATLFRSSALDVKADDVDLVVDGVIGYGLSGTPRGKAADMLRWANKQTAPVLALDTPSGLDLATGEAFDPAVIAAATLTLALPKTGLKSHRKHVGELYLADISVPPELYEKILGLAVGPLFAQSDIIRLE